MKKVFFLIILSIFVSSCWNNVNTVEDDTKIQTWVTNNLQKEDLDSTSLWWWFETYGWVWQELTR